MIKRELREPVAKFDIIPDFHKFKTRLTLTIPSLAAQLGNESLAVLLLMDPPKPVVLAVCKK